MSFPFPEPTPAVVSEMELGTEVLAHGPTFAWFSPTGRCNLYCTHCPIRIVPRVDPETPDLGDALLERFVREVLPSLDALKIGGNNNGEPVLARNFDHFFEQVQRPGLRPWIITNGTLLTEEQIERLAAAGTVIDFSMDAVDEKRYRQIRGRGHDRVMANIQRAVAARDRHRDADARVWLSLTAFRTNLDEIPRVVEMGLERGVDGVRVSQLMPMSEAQRFEALLYHRTEANRIFARCREMVAGTSLELILPETFEQPDHIRTDSKVRRHAPERPPCVHPWTSVSIDERGLVHPCCVSDQVLGDLRKQSFEEIWNGRDYRELRRTVNGPRPPLYCRRCSLRGAGATQNPGANEEDLLSIIGPSRTVDPSQFLIFYLMEKADRSKVAGLALRAYLWWIHIR